MGSVGNADFTFLDRDAVQPLAARLISQHKAVKPLGGQLEGAVDAPNMITLSGECPLLRHGGGVDQADHPAAPGRRHCAGGTAPAASARPTSAVSQCQSPQRCKR